MATQKIPESNLINEIVYKDLSRESLNPQDRGSD